MAADVNTSIIAIIVICMDMDFTTAPKRVPEDVKKIGDMTPLMKTAGEMMTQRVEKVVAAQRHELRVTANMRFCNV